MEKKAEFLKKLSGLVANAKEQGSQISVEEVKAYFTDEVLTEEQMELVFDYLLAQKIVVKGYIKMDESEEEQISFTQEEEQYLEEYLEDLKAFRQESDGERQGLYEKVIHGDEEAKARLIELCLQDVVEIAKEMYQGDIFLGDLIQEGNVGMILGVDMLQSAADAKETIDRQVRESIRLLMEEHAELKDRDQQMISKVNQLDESITALTEELGRKVSIDELAVYMGVSEEEIEDILKLTGEEVEEEEEV